MVIWQGGRGQRGEKHWSLLPYHKRNHDFLPFLTVILVLSGSTLRNLGARGLRYYRIGIENTILLAQSIVSVSKF